MRPFGEDLTGKVEVLPYPNKKYFWAIGTGAMTDVFKGELRREGAPMELVAIKIFRATATDEQERVQALNRRLIRESNVWLGLCHTNIHPYLGYCEDLGLSVALISPLCMGGTIIKYLCDNPSANRLKFVKDVAMGLEYLHSNGIIHADLQRNNVLVDDSGNARLCDFGRARVIGDAAYSTKLVAGCLPYMAPELLVEDEAEDSNVDELFTLASDVYAFGILSFEIFTDVLHLGSTRRGAGFMACIMRHIREGMRPERTSDKQRLISDAVWDTMQACWDYEPTQRLSAAAVVQRIV